MCQTFDITEHFFWKSENEKLKLKTKNDNGKSFGKFVSMVYSIVAVLPNEGLAGQVPGQVPAKPSFWYDNDSKN